MAGKEKKITKNEENPSCCSPQNIMGSCCKVEALVTVDERGQMVLPKSIRDRAGIKPEDKMCVVTWEKNDKICCITLIKAEEIAEMTKNILGPLMKERF